MQLEYPIQEVWEGMLNLKHLSHQGLLTRKISYRKWDCYLLMDTGNQEKPIFFALHMDEADISSIGESKNSVFKGAFNGKPVLCFQVKEYTQIETMLQYIDQRIEHNQKIEIVNYLISQSA